MADLLGAVRLRDDQGPELDAHADSDERAGMRLVQGRARRGRSLPDWIHAGYALTEADVAEPLRWCRAASASSSTYLDGRAIDCAWDTLAACASRGRRRPSRSAAERRPALVIRALVPDSPWGLSCLS